MITMPTQHTSAETWIIVGASRGIGLEFVKQLLGAGHRVVAAVRNVAAASRLFELIASMQVAADRCLVEQCDISSDESITVGNPPCPGLEHPSSC